MWNFVMMPQNMPFCVAITVVLMIALLEGVGVFLGAGVSTFLENLVPSFDFDVDTPDLEASSALGKALSWLNIGKVPVLVWIIINLLIFGFIGLMIQGISEATVGYLLPASLASLASMVIALPLVRTCINGLAAIMPEDETNAVSMDDFIGKVAVITLGKASYNRPARAKVKDRFGKSHYILVAPDNEGDNFKQGESVLIIKRDSAIYKCIENNHELLAHH